MKFSRSFFEPNRSIFTGLILIQLRRSMIIFGNILNLEQKIIKYITLTSHWARIAHITRIDHSNFCVLNFCTFSSFFIHIEVYGYTVSSVNWRCSSWTIEIHTHILTLTRNDSCQTIHTNALECDTVCSDSNCFTFLFDGNVISYYECDSFYKHLWKQTEEVHLEISINLFILISGNAPEKIKYFEMKIEFYSGWIHISVKYLLRVFLCLFVLISCVFMCVCVSMRLCGGFLFQS